MSTKQTDYVAEPVSSIIWAVLTSIGFLPAIPFWWFIFCPIIAAVVLVSKGKRPPALFLTAYLVAAASRFLNNALGPISIFAGPASSLQAALGSPLIVEPQLLFSRALFAYFFYYLINFRNGVAIRAIAWNLVVSSAALLGLIGFSSTSLLNLSNVAVSFVVFWTILLLGNFLFAIRCNDLTDNTGKSETVWSIASIGLAFGFFIMGILAIPNGKRGVAPGGPPTVAFFRPGPHWPDTGEFRTSLSNFGLSNIGLFGDMEEFLRRFGYNVFDLDSLSQLNKFSPTILYCPTLFRALSASEKLAIQQFLRKGGAMVAVGEHTNLGSNADRYNSLFEPFGLRLNFDNTNGLFGEGLSGADVSNDALGKSVLSSPLLTHNRGASITISNASAQAILVGHYWQADAGDSLAPEKAFLGDGTISRKDRLGNVILMAVARAGRGRIFLSGDSSPFLNQNLAYNSQFLANLFRVLTFRSSNGLWAILPAIGVVITVFALSLFLRKSRVSQLVMALSFFSVGAAISFEYSVERTLASNFAMLQDGNWVIISTAENNLFNHDPFSPKSLTALALQAFRTGGLPAIGSWRGIKSIPKAVVIVNPTIEPTKSYLAALRNKISEGSHAILAGDGTNKAFQELAAAFGFTVSEQPLGSISSESLTTFTAWRVASIPIAASAVKVGQTFIGGTVPVGLGRVTVLADGGFFFSKNLEMEGTYDEKNCHFVQSLLEMK